MWAGIASILVGIGKLVGVEVDQQELTNAFVGLSDPLSQIIGGAVVMWGRKRASTKITG